MKHDADWLKILKGSIKSTAERSHNPVKGMDIILDRPVIGKILVLPRSSIEKFENPKPWACLSIGADAPGDFPSKLSKENQKGFLRMHFPDMEGYSTEYREHCEKQGRILPPCFNTDQAKEIVDFVKPLWNEIDLLVLHCHAGLSRSAAVGKALSEYYTQPHTELYDKLYMPNRLVYKLVKEALNK